MDWFFEILIPSVRPPFEVTEADFADDFSSIFRENSMEYETSFTDEVPLATVFLAQQQPQAPPVHTQQMQQPKQTILPSLETLPRPEILLRETPPYHILVEVLNDKIKVMGSHEASLSLLCGYLKKWIRNAKDMAPNVSCLFSTSILRPVLPTPLPIPLNLSWPRSASRISFCQKNQ